MKLSNGRSLLRPQMSLTQTYTSSQRQEELTYIQKRNIYGLLYKIFVKKDKSVLGTSAKESEKGKETNSEFDKEVRTKDVMRVHVCVQDDPDIRAARDKYVQEQTRELLYSMKTTEIPKGVKFSFIMMSFPLLCTTTYLGLLAPMVSAGTGIVDPASFAYLARTCLRLLALNISFTVRIIIFQLALGWYSLWTSISNL